jgi:uncharacterized membrane protein
MNSTEVIVHIVHVLAAGIWLGGLVFTTIVVSPAFKAMPWTPAERIAVRSAVGRQYTKVANPDLILLVIFAIADTALRGSMTRAIEIFLAIIVAILAVLHGLVFAPRLGAAARENRHDDRAKLLRLSMGISMLNLLLSFVVMILAIGFSVSM